jgi:AcrR family transcriptional regulator
VANEAGLAKATIYLYFDSKEELFAALAAQLCEASLSGVESALAAPRPLARRLAGALDAKIGHFHRLLAGSAHAAELLDESASIEAGASSTWTARSGRRSNARSRARSSRRGGARAARSSPRRGLRRRAPEQLSGVYDAAADCARLERLRAPAARSVGALRGASARVS